MSDTGDFKATQAQALGDIEVAKALRARDIRRANDDFEVEDLRVPTLLGDADSGTLEMSEPVEISFERMWEEALERDRELGEKAWGEDFEQARRYCPQAYVRLDGAAPLDGVIIDYECNGHTHPVTIFAPKDKAVYIQDGSLVPSNQLPEGYNLHDALMGAYGEITANILYYPQSFCFHPDAVIQKTSGFNPVTLSGEPRQVLTIDTARTGAQVGKGMYDGTDSYTDPWPRDDVSGHGHAIADLIGRMTAEPSASMLYGFRPGTGNTYQMISSSGERFRAFDAAMLMANLKDADEAHEGAKIMNLSLGAPAPPAAMINDPIGTWLNDWIDRGTGRAVVAAAGNHQTCVPDWPAAHSGTWATPSTGASKKKHGATLPHHERIYSVGSEGFYADYKSSTNSAKDPFSAENDLKDKWIGFQRKGRDVAVKFDDTTVNHAWTGTSFAAPQVAAELAISSVIPRKKP